PSSPCTTVVSHRPSTSRNSTPRRSWTSSATSPGRCPPVTSPPSTSPSASAATTSPSPSAAPDPLPSPLLPCDRAVEQVLLGRHHQPRAQGGPGSTAPDRPRHRRDRTLGGLRSRRWP